ncbi:MAG: TauD/TfdA family dioxygenase [Burkholderiaceae bacterium]|nr:TauD/TfdA family dioxygenase [Burkholderiaceae bacterium]
MTITITPLDDSFAVQVSGIQPSGAVRAEDIAAMRKALTAHGVVVIRGQKFDDREHIEFSRHFGELEIHTQRAWLLPDMPEILALNNRGERGTKPIMNGGSYWHSDVSYKAMPPMGSLLHAIEIPPEGGDTLYSNMCEAYDALDDETKTLIDGRRAIHSYAHRYQAQAAGDPERPQLTAEQLAEIPAVGHPMVRTHPETGRKALFVNEGFTTGIEGMDDAEARALLDRLFAHCVDPRFVYRHRWQVDDLVFWDNRMTQHSATSFDQRFKRNMHRTTVAGDVPA